MMWLRWHKTCPVTRVSATRMRLCDARGRRARFRLLLGASAVAFSVVVLAGCNGQHSTAGAAATPMSSLPPAPTPEPVSTPTNPASLPTAISGDYTLYKRPVLCSGVNLTCYTERMRVRITCVGGSCTIIRTNGNSAAGLQPWTVAIPLSYNGQAWQGRGSEPDAAECRHNPAPAAVQFTLTVASGADSNGVWKAQQIVGTYTGVEAPNICDKHRAAKGVFLLSTARGFVPYRYKNPKSLNLLQLKADLAYFKTAMDDFAASAKLNSQQRAELGNLTHDLAGCEADPNPLNPECGSYLTGVILFLQPATAG
jgi:hypothetical protein